MNATTLPGKVADVEHDDKSRSSSLAVQHGSPSNTSIVFNGAAGSETVPKSAGRSFDLFTKQLGSHMAFRAEETECLMMFMELESCEIKQPPYAGEANHSYSVRYFNLRG